MLQPIIVMGERTARVVRRVDKDALHTPRKFLLQRLKRQQVVAENQTVIKDVILSHAMCGVVRLLGVFEQDARLQLRALFLAGSR